MNESQAPKGGAIVPCPECGKGALMFEDDDTIVCPVCNTKWVDPKEEDAHLTALASGHWN